MSATSVARRADWWKTWQQFQKRLPLSAASRVTVSVCRGAAWGTFLTAGWLQFVNTWGRGPEVFSFAVAVILIGLFVAVRCQGLIPVPVRFSMLLSAAVAVCFPWWLGATTALVETFARGWSAPLWSLVLPTTVLALVPWTVVLATAGRSLFNRNSDAEGLIASLSACLGAVVCVVTLGPVLGLATTVVMAALAIILADRLDRVGQTETLRSVKTNGRLYRPAAGTSIESSCCVFVSGILLATLVAAVGEFFPAGQFAAPVGFAGWAIGLLLAKLVSGANVADRTRTFQGLMGLAGWSGAWLLISVPLVDGLLTFNAFVTSSQLVIAARAGLVLLVALPLGWFAGLCANERSRLLDGSPAAWGWFFVGILAASAIRQAGVMNSTIFAGTAILALAAAIVVALTLRQAGQLVIGTYRSRLIVATAVMLAIAAPWLSAGQVTGRSVRLLFNSAVLMARQTVWDKNTVSQLDDQRLLAASNSWQGEWTLWKSRGVLVHARESGIPRGVWSGRVDSHPQSLSETLSVLYPLVLAESNDRVLLVGTGLGIPLTTVVEFPVQQIDLISNNPPGRQSIGSALDATRHLPVDDSRVTSRHGEVLPLLRSSSATYDTVVVAASPLVLPHTAAFLTSDFYHLAARRLTPNGCFCQHLVAVDYGPDILAGLLASLQDAFSSTALVECGPGEYLLLGSNSEQGLIGADTLAQLQSPQVDRCLARCGWDWSSVLNLPAYDHAAIAEMVADRNASPHRTADCRLALLAPHEVARWGTKLIETQEMLGAPRRSDPMYAAPDESSSTLTAARSRRSRLLDWLGSQANDKALLRRLSEVAAHHKLIAEHPDSFWWDYRKALREELQKRPRSEVQQVSFSSEEKVFHPEDARRRDYFAALGHALQQAHPSPDELNNIETLLVPYDPLMTLFAHQELADLAAKAGDDRQRELRHRLHVIFYTGSEDGSLRNVRMALELLNEHPEAEPNPADRFDLVNGLLQLLRTRWDVRSRQPTRSTRQLIRELDEEIVVVAASMKTLEQSADEAGLDAKATQMRLAALEQILVRPMRDYREGIATRAEASRMKTRLLLEQADKNGSDKGSGIRPSQLPADLLKAGNPIW